MSGFYAAEVTVPTKTVTLKNTGDAMVESTRLRNLEALEGCSPRGSVASGMNTDRA